MSNEINEEYVESKISDNDLYFQDMFDKKLTITIPGEPIPGERPRPGYGRSFYMPHKNKIKKIFKKVYEQDNLLQKTCITTPTASVVKIYTEPKNKFEKKLLRDHSNEFKGEDVIAINRKDLDNYLKSHWDLLQYEDFKIILDDSYICKSLTEKYYSTNPRIEINILFSDEKPYLYDFFEKDIKKKVRYNKQMLSKKHLDSNTMSDKEFIEHFSKHIKKFTLNKMSNVMEFLMKNLTLEQVQLILSEINEQLVVDKHSACVQSLATYLVECNGKLD